MALHFNLKSLLLELIYWSINVDYTVTNLKKHFQWIVMKLEGKMLRKSIWALSWINKENTTLWCAIFLCCLTGDTKHANVIHMPYISYIYIYIYNCTSLSYKYKSLIYLKLEITYTMHKDILLVIIDLSLFAMQTLSILFGHWRFIYYWFVFAEMLSIQI